MRGLVDEKTDCNVLYFNEHIEQHLLDQLPKEVKWVVLADLARLFHLLYYHVLLLLLHSLLEVGSE